MEFGIICACLPCLKPFVKRYFPNLPFFDANFEQRVVSSFRISNRVAQFNTIDPQTDFVSAEANSTVLHPKPSRFSNEREKSMD